MRIGRIMVSDTVLLASLGFPPSSRVEVVRMAPNHAVEMSVQSSLFDDVGVGDSVPLYDVILSTTYCSHGAVQDTEASVEKVE